MKTITCSQMGGTCDTQMTAATPDEMIAEGMKHIEAFHPDMAKDVHAMSDADMATWHTGFMKTWAATPDNK